MIFRKMSQCLLFCFLSTKVVIAKEYRVYQKLHFTQGRFKIDNHPYKYINSKQIYVFNARHHQSFEIEAIKSKDLTFYTLTVKRHGSVVMVINDFAIMSKTSKIRMLKEGWIEDINRDGYFDIVQREKTFILNKRTPSSNYNNDKLRVKLWSTKQSLFLEEEASSWLFKKSLKKYNFKLHTFYKGTVI